MSGEDDTSDESHEDNDSHQSIRNSDDSDDDIPTEPGKADSSVVSPKGKFCIQKYSIIV
jgi:hypothetical protein